MYYNREEFKLTQIFCFTVHFLLIKFVIILENTVDSALMQEYP